MIAEWSTAVPDWEARLLAGESLLPAGLPFFEAEADAAMEIFNGLRVVDVAGAPTMGQACRPWARDFVRTVFGAYDHATGRRLIRYFLLLIAKKNTKSTIAAGIGLTLLMRNWRRSAELLILAPTIENAGNSYQPARDMIKADEALDALLHPQDHLKTITHRKTGATLKIVAADSETVSGKKASVVIVDELWLFGKRHNAESMLREAMGGLASRPEGMVIYLSTHSDEAPTGVWAKTLTEFRGIRDGKIHDPRSLGVLYEFPKRMLETEGYRDPATWHLTNPNLGASVDLEFLLDQRDKAERAGKDSFIGFAAKHLNVEIGQTLLGGWAGAEFWQGCTEPGLDLDELLARSEVVTIGIDGGGLDDLLALAVIGRETGTGRWLLWGRAWAHPIVLERRKSERSRFEDFAAIGDLVFADDFGSDVEELAAIVAQVNEARLLPFEMPGIGVDAAGISDVIEALAGQGIEGPDHIVAVSQGWALSGVIKTVERKLAEKMLAHGGQPLFAYSVGNAKPEPRGNAVLITKAASGTAKIDPVMAMFDAAALMRKNPQGALSVYGNRDMMVV